MNQNRCTLRSPSLMLVMLGMLLWPALSEAQLTWAMEQKENWFPTLPSGWTRQPCHEIQNSLGCAFGPDGAAVTLQATNAPDLQALLAAVNRGTDTPDPLPPQLRVRNETEASSAVVAGLFITLATVFRPWGAGYTDARILIYGVSRAEHEKHLATAVGIMALVRQQYAAVALRVTPPMPPIPPSLRPTTPIVGDSPGDLSPAKYGQSRQSLLSRFLQ